MEGIIFDIQHYAIYDGPGIRTLIFFKGCPLRCQWCQNPESQATAPEFGYLAERCTGCGQCAGLCPTGALTMHRRRPVRDLDRCTWCGTCVHVCRQHATELIGRRVTVDEVVEEVLRDRPFYAASGGGVTCSGGEATVQATFLVAILSQLKAAGIHTALETCGHFHPALLVRLVECVDLFLYDIKQAISDRHQAATGVPNDRIVANLRAVVDELGPSANERVLVRVPIIPGTNDDDRSITALIDFLSTLNWSGVVHLMPYNHLARTKWEKLGRADEYLDLGERSHATLEHICDRLLGSGIRSLVSE